MIFIHKSIQCGLCVLIKLHHFYHILKYRFTLFPKAFQPSVVWETPKLVVLETEKTQVNGLKCGISSGSTLFDKVKTIFRFFFKL